MRISMMRGTRAYGEFHMYVLTRSPFSPAVCSAEICVGTPPKVFELIVDTGSALMAMPCSGCSQCGHHKAGARFDPRASSSSTPVSCSSHPAAIRCSGCSSNQCTYSVSYAEGSRIGGHMVMDQVTFQSDAGTRGVFACVFACARARVCPCTLPRLRCRRSRRRSVCLARARAHTRTHTHTNHRRARSCSSHETLAPSTAPSIAPSTAPSTAPSIAGKKSIPVGFGCQTLETGLFNSQVADGIVGFSWGGGYGRTLFDTLRDELKAPDIFSMCLSETQGAMVLGGTVNEAKIGATPWIPFTSSSSYTVAVSDFIVAGASVGSASSVYSSTIVDSGTTFTYLPPAPYYKARDRWRNVCPWGSCATRTVKGQYPDDYCYKMSVEELRRFEPYGEASCGGELRRRAAEASCGGVLRRRAAEASCGGVLRRRAAEACCGGVLRRRAAEP